MKQQPLLRGVHHPTKGHKKINQSKEKKLKTV